MNLNLLPLSFLLIPLLPAQEGAKGAAQDGAKKEPAACCQDAAKATAKAEGCCATAESPLAAITAATAKIKALPAVQRTELAAAAKTLAEGCPGTKSALQMLSVLQGAAAAAKAHPDCCAVGKAGHGEGGQENAAAQADRFTNLVKTIDAHWALMTEVGFQPVKPDCCEAKAKAAAQEQPKAGAKVEGAKVEDKKGDCCEGGAGGKECCGDTNELAKFGTCALSVANSAKGFPARVKALDKDTVAKVAAAAAVLDKHGLMSPTKDAIAFFNAELTALSKCCGDEAARGEKAAEGGCPAGAEMQEKAAAMAKVVGSLATMTQTFVKAYGECCGGETKAGGCCSEGAGACCEAGKAEGKQCCDEKLKVEAAKKEPAKKD